MMRIISGPTGSGKTAAAEKLIRENEWVFNCDAFQFYSEIPVLSAQSQGGMRDRYRFLGDRSIRDPISAGEFSRMAEPYLSTPGVWAGVGLYLGAAVYGLDLESKKGTPFQGLPKVSYRMVVLNPDRQNLYESLNQRVDQMMGAGALEEARAIHDLRNTNLLEVKNPVLKAIGLKHLLEYLDGVNNLERTVELWKRDTRRLAKRQWTWLRKFCPPGKDILWVEDFDQNLSHIQEFLKS